MLVTGGRNYQDRARVYAELSKLNVSILIHGGATGADSLAADWAWESGVHTAEVRAQWHHYGKAAGHRRNAAMASLKPDVLVAFPGGRGTADMVSKARNAGIGVIEVTECF